MEYFIPPKINIEIKWYQIDNHPIVPYAATDGCVSIDGDWGVLNDKKDEIREQLLSCINNIINNVKTK